MQPHDIADHNLERLLHAAYQPEPVDPDFAQRVQAALLEEANRLAEQRAPRLPLVTPALRRLRMRLGWALGLAAAVAVVAIVWYARTPRGPWHHDQSDDRWRGEFASWREETGPGLRPRALPAAPAVTSLAVGATLTTGPGQRRRVGLADGSIVYVNQDTQFNYTADRRLELTRGEVYVEVAPRLGHVSGATFLIKTPAREVTALGTRFGVRTNDEGAGVVVTQGTVKVGGIEQPLHAGQQLIPGSAKPQPAPRVSQVLDWTRELMAAAESPLVPACKHGGGALLALDPNGQEVNLTLRINHIDVFIEDGFARTTIDQTFFNNLYGRTEGTFYFPLPPDASLSRLAMYVEDKDGLCKLMEGGMAERDHARNVYETILHQRRDPALLEWVDGSTFKMRVFPLEGRKEKRILLSYTQRLHTHDGKTSYRFPAGHSMDLVRDSSFSVRIRGRGEGRGVRGEEMQVKCTSHPEAKLTRELKDTVVAWSGQNVKQDKDIAVEIVDAQARGLAEDQVRFSSFTHEKHNFLMVRYKPFLSAKPQAERRDWIVLFESSANRDPLVARAQVEIVRKLMENAGQDDTIAVVIAGARTRVLDKALLPLTKENRAAAIEFLDSAHLIGALDLGAALDALAPYWKAAKNPHILHVGGGIPAMGETQLDRLVHKIPEDIRYVGVGVGKRWNRAFMKQAAERTGGLFTQINPDESIGWRAFDLLATLNTPRLLNLRVLDHGEKAAFLTDAALLSQGEELCAITRYPGERPDKIIIAGRLDGKQFTRVFPVKDVQPEAGYLPRTWAKLEIERLLADGAEKNKDAVTQLSKSSYVMSPFTSLLVLETDADYEKYKIDRGRKDHWAMYPAPDRIPIVQEWGNQPPVDAKNKNAKPTAEQVLETVLVRVPPTVVSQPGQALEQHRQALTVKQLFQGVAGIEVPVKFFKNLGDLGLSEEFGIEMGLQTPTVYWREMKERGLESRKIFEKDRKRQIPRRMLEEINKSIANQQIVGPTGLVVPTKWKYGEMERQRKQQFSLLNLSDRPESLEVLAARIAFPQFMEEDLKQAVRQLKRRMPQAEERELLRSLMLSNNAGDWDGETIRLMQVNADVTARIFDEVFNGRGTIPFGDGGKRIYLLPDPATNSIMIRGKPLDLLTFRSMLERGLNSGMSEQTYHFAPLFGRPPMTWAIPNTQLGRYQILSQPVTEGGSIVLFDGNFDRFIPSGQAIDFRETMQMHTSIPGGVIGGKVRRSYARYPEAMKRGLDRVVNLEPRKPLEPFVYDRPQFIAEPRFFGDLTLFAPGLNTWNEDIVAALEQETRHQDPIKMGTIDPAAKGLIDQARSAGWQAVAIPAFHREPEYKIRFNGAGQFAFERTLAIGLREQVVCDGQTMLHMYPEIGLAGKRTYTKYHQQAADLAPWLLPTAQTLARGYDVKAIDAQTVALIRIGAKPKDADLQTHLVFAPDGRLAERRLVLEPKQEVLLRVIHDGQGGTKVVDAKGKVLTEQTIKVTAAQAPDLAPPTKDLVVVPMPLRTQGKIVPEGKIDRYESLSEEQMIALLAEAVAHGNGPYALQLYGYRFTKDPRPGFLTLLTASGVQLKFNEPMDVNGVKARFDLSEPRFQTPLGKYLVHHHRNQGAKLPALMEYLSGPGFIPEFTHFRNLHTLYTTRKVRPENGFDLGAENQKIHDFLSATRSPLLAFAIQDALFKDGELVNNQTYAQLAAAFPDAGLFTSVFRYENGRGQIGTATGSKAEARKVFTAYYEDGLKDGVVMPIEDRFIEALGKDGGFAEFLRKKHGELIKEGRTALALAVAQQAHEVQPSALADELFMASHRAADPDERLLVGWVVINYLEKVKQVAPAESLVKELLADPWTAQLPSLWRRAANLARERGLSARAAEAMDKALDLEYQDLPEVVNLEPIRADYRAMLTQYQQLAGALPLNDRQASKDLLAKVVRAADRWRALDPDNAEPCNLAAKVLNLLGARELAWDYLTTPIGAKPNESGPWLNLAKALRDEADYALADLAYAQAFQAEATNPQILWDRAINLQNLGQQSAANRLIRQIAEGQWQERFNSLKVQAQAKAGR